MKANVFIITALLALSSAIDYLQAQERGDGQHGNERRREDRGLDVIWEDTVPPSPVYKESTQLFNSGFIDVLNNGQVNAAARLIRLYIGEPGGLILPLSFYSGVSANNFGGYPGYAPAISNEILITNFINPLSGLMNVSFDGIHWLHRVLYRISRYGLIYQLGERVLTGYRVGDITDPLTGQAINFLNSFMTAGVYLQTGAGEKRDSGERGICWFAARLIACYTRPAQLNRFLPGLKTNGLYHGYSVGWGITIGGLVDMKFVFYQYWKKPELDYHLPICQFSFNYSFKK